MNRSDSPKKQPKPFGVNGQRVAILPTTPAGDNSASYEHGFPPITMILKSAGGLPPKGQDMNQILYELSALGRWSSTGALNTFDSEFASEISGYPSGAMLISNDGERIFINTTEGNLSDPNSNGAGWKDILSYLGLSQVAKKDTNNNFTGTNTFTGGVALSANTTLAGIGLQYILDGKQPINAILTALAGQTPEANKLAYFTGVDSFGLTDLSAFIRAMLGKADAAATRTYLDLGNASLRDVGTNIGQIPDMSAWTKGGPATGRWRKSPDGLIEQWGSAGISDAYGNAAVTFPIAFTSAPDFVLFGPRNVTAPTRMTSIVLDESNLRNTGFTCRCFDQLDGTTTPSTSNFYWYCRGY
ncbi:TPA: phage tail protein [Escherichia coli]|nr:phage tail protein [Escherichia coli]